MESSQQIEQVAPADIVRSQERTSEKKQNENKSL
jgi:hypothetical protein